MAGEALYEALTNLGNLYTQRLREDRIRQQHQEDIQGERAFVASERDARQKWATQEADEKAARDREQALWAQEQSRKKDGESLGLGENASWSEITKAKEAHQFDTAAQQMVFKDTVDASDRLQQGAAAAHNVNQLNKQLQATAKDATGQLQEQLDTTVPAAKQAWLQGKEIYDKIQQLHPSSPERIALAKQLVGYSDGLVLDPNQASRMLYETGKDGKAQIKWGLLDQIFKGGIDNANDYAVRAGIVTDKQVVQKAQMANATFQREMMSGARLDATVAQAYAQAVDNLSKTGWALGVPAEQQPLYQKYKNGVTQLREKFPQSAAMLDQGDSFASRLDKMFEPAAALGTPPGVQVGPITVAPDDPSGSNGRIEEPVQPPAANFASTAGLGANASASDVLGNMVQSKEANIYRLEKAQTESALAAAADKVKSLQSPDAVEGVPSFWERVASMSNDRIGQSVRSQTPVRKRWTDEYDDAQAQYQKAAQAKAAFDRRPAPPGWAQTP